MPPRPPPEPLDPRLGAAEKACPTDWRRWSEAEADAAEEAIKVLLFI